MSDAAKRAIEHRLKRQAKKRRRMLLRRIFLIGIAAALLTALIAVILAFLIPKLTADEPTEPTVPAQETLIELEEQAGYGNDIDAEDIKKNLLLNKVSDWLVEHCKQVEQ
jgi:hypothetical protein